MRVIPTMLLRSSSIAFVFCAFAAAAEDRLPSIDVKASCEASAKAVFKATGDKNAATAENCLKQENAARDQIVKSWDIFTAADRAQCINVKVYMPSYVEWLTCLQMQRQVRDERKK